MQNVTDILQAVKSGLGLSSDKALAEHLNIPSATLAAWRNRNSINYDKIIALCEANGLSLDLVFLGSTYKKGGYLTKEEYYKDKYLKCLEEKDSIHQRLINDILKQ